MMRYCTCGAGGSTSGGCDVCRQWNPRSKRMSSDKCKIRPLDDRVVCQREEPEGKSKGGILLPDSAKEKPQRAVVLRVGPGAWFKDGGERQPMQVKVGDTVLLTNWAGSEVEHDGEKYLVVRECDILSVVE